MAMAPARSYPDCMRMRWTVPTAGFPHIAIPIPAVITRDPNVVPARPYASALYNCSRRPYPDNDFRRSG